MPNDPMTNEAQMSNDEKTFAAPLEEFVIRASLFIRHSSFVIRHFR
jgi:hypothetical protein